MKIFVTGATGVIGRRLVALLRHADHDVTGVARSAKSRAQLERQGATAINVDLFDAQAVARAVAGHDVVVNLATHIPASSAQMFLPWKWRENDRIRKVASSTLVDACLASSVMQFVQESFAPVYPDCGDRWIDETVPIKTVRYNRTIEDAEASAARFSAGGRAGVVVRFGAFYGPDATQTHEFAAAVRRGYAPLPGRPDAYISSISHDDAASAVAAAITLPPGIYNATDDDPVTHAEFISSLADAIGVRTPKLPPRWVTPLLGSLGKLLSRSERISNLKLRTSSSWTPAYRSVREGWRALASELGPARLAAPLTADKSVRG
jgi:nucleoside-diphosphate-sugar epimerase